MSEWLHCNKCCAQQSPSSAFFLAECGHIFCKKCVEPIRENLICVLCRKTGNILHLNKNVKQEVLDFFTPVEDMGKKLLEVNKFQLEHRNSLIRLMCKKYSVAKEQYLRMMSLNKKLQRENEMMRTMLKECQDRNFRFATSTPVSQMSERNVTFQNVSLLSSIPPNNRGTPSGNYPGFPMRNFTLGSSSSKGPSPALARVHRPTTMRSLEELRGRPRLN